MGDRYRTGRKVGRTIYRQVSDTPSDADQFIGVMDTREFAAAVVDALNAATDGRLLPAGGETRNIFYSWNDGGPRRWKRTVTTFPDGRILTEPWTPAEDTT